MPKRPEPAQAGALITTVYVVVTPGVLLLDLAGIAEPFRLANRLPEALRAGRRLDVRMVGAGAQVDSALPVSLSGIGPLPEALAPDCWVVIAGVSDDGAAGLGERAAAESCVAAWLRHRVAPMLAAGAARLWTVCSGAFLAARAGLLDGRQCTTHHSLIDRLATEHPAARVQSNRIFVVDGPVATSAGITAGIDLALHAIGELCGSAAALALARELVVYHRRAGGDPQLPPGLRHRNHLHSAVHRAQDALLASPARAWSVASLAEAAHVSTRHLARLFKDNAGIAPLDYLQQIRIDLAEAMLRAGDLSVERVAEQSGFSSAHHLRRVWHKFHGRAPASVRGEKRT